MTTEVEVSKSFQDRLFEKIRTDIGALMSDDDLKKLVDKAFEREFFTPGKKRDPRSSDYRPEYIETPPPIQLLLRELLEPSLRQVLTQWVVDHEKELLTAMHQAVGDNVLTAAEKITADRVGRVVGPHFEQVVREVQKIRDHFSKQGVYL